jgi:hypothetical protein
MTLLRRLSPKAWALTTAFCNWAFRSMRSLFVYFLLSSEQNALRADSGNVRGVLRDQLVVRLRRRCRV